MEPSDPSARPKTSRLRRHGLVLPQTPIPLKGSDLPKCEEEFEVDFFEHVIAKDPCEEGALTILAHAYTQRGEYEKGLELDRRLVRLRPDDPVAFYNLACSLSLVGRPDEAFEALEHSVRMGYRDFEHMLEDPDLQPLRLDERFERFLRRMRLGGPEGSGGRS